MGSDRVDIGEDRLHTSDAETPRSRVRQAELLVDMLQYKGIRVAPVTCRHLQEIYVALTALEIKAVALIGANQPTIERLAVLSQARCDMVMAVRDNHREAMLMADDRFHCGWLELSGKAYLAAMGVRFRDRVRPGHCLVVRLAPDNRMPKPLVRHRDLIRKRRSNDPVNAAMARDKQRVSEGTKLLKSIERSELDVF